MTKHACVNCCEWDWVCLWLALFPNFLFIIGFERLCIIPYVLFLVFLKGGMYLLQLLDHHVCSGTSLLLLSFCQSVSIGWVYGKSQTNSQPITDCVVTKKKDAAQIQNNFHWDKDQGVLVWYRLVWNKWLVFLIALFYLKVLIVFMVTSQTWLAIVHTHSWSTVGATSLLSPVL